jgi:UDP-N-acetylglucosamine--N-acetylmuramyl-(pentapeptide) pyrophosphoryl-undecaprenol N-acetylglucosamine transferase
MKLNPAKSPKEVYRMRLRDQRRWKDNESLGHRGRISRPNQDRFLGSEIEIKVRTPMTTLFVASNGGHLAQLYELSNRMNGLGKDRLWVTFDDAQAGTLLDGEERIFIPPIAERDIKGVLQALGYAHRLMRAPNRVRAVVSTGSAVALAFLPYAALRGIEAHYIESAARVSTPSLTGRMLATVPGVRLYRQYPHAADGRWRFGGSVFDGLRGVDIEPRSVKRVVVTVGTMSQQFRRLVEAVAAILPPETEVVWQTGHTSSEGLGIDARRFLPASVIAQAMRDADVVVAHSGCGSALTALLAGKYPVLVPRDPCHGEVIDSHQIEIARWLSQQGLALYRTPEDLGLADLKAAAARAVARTSDPPPFRLWEPQ